MARHASEKAAPNPAASTATIKYFFMVDFPQNEWPRLRHSILRPALFPIPPT
jgi:hypothetical protein